METYRVKLECPACSLRIAIVATLAILTNVGCAHSDEWTRRDTIRQLGVTVTITGDAWTTSRIHKTPGVYEKGRLVRPFLGTQPDPTEVYIFFASAAITNYFIARALPAKWRPWFQTGMMIGYIRNIENNCELDLC